MFTAREDENRRLLRARDLIASLRTTTTPVTDIARSVGYESLGTFGRTFSGIIVDTDVDMGFMRWLTVAPPGQPDLAFPALRRSDGTDRARR